MSNQYAPRGGRAHGQDRKAAESSGEVGITGNFSESRAKRHLQITLGKMLQPFKKGQFDELAPYLRAANVLSGGVDFSDTKFMWFSQRDKVKYSLRAGDLVVLEGGDVGRSALVDDVEYEYLGYQNSLHRVRPRLGNDASFAMYWLHHLKAFGYIDHVCSKSTLSHFTAEKFAEAPYPAINHEIQKTIADFLDRETAHIDQLIEKKQMLLSVKSNRIEALVDKAISDQNVPRIRFENLVHRVRRPAQLSEHDELVRLGLYNRGRGIFKKPAAGEDEIGVSDFFFIKSGDLILSGQFAWEGAVALASEDEEGCVVSHRYPVFLGRSGVNTAYLLGLFRSSYGDFLLNEASRGSAGRNRPLNTWRLGKEKIPQPSDDLQRTIEKAILVEQELKKKTTASIDRLREYRSALITAAVTGQIDVATWSRRRQTDRSLDTIEATQA